jgi:predicted nucleic acid-binding protein
MAFFEDEPGAEKVEQILAQAEDGKTALIMSIVNWGEVYYSIYRSQGEEKAEESILIIEQLPIKIADVDRDLMYQAAKLKANHAIALGDCLAAALAKNMNYTIVTGDKEFKKLGNKVRVEWIK